MKAIDLHIHTTPTLSDSSFQFSMDALEKYVKNMELDIIGITNHNIFDLDQFLDIDEKLKIKVLPGIEINFGGGHLLLLADNNNLEDFDSKCKKIESKISSVNDMITMEELREIFKDLTKYLLIPHHPKKPKVPLPIIRSFSTDVIATEVSSIKDFLREHKENKHYVPLWFSDMRASINSNKGKRGRTYLNIEGNDISSIKMGLLDREKVKLTLEESNKLFPINNLGLQVSTGLNVLIGARSSGKSYFLNEVNNSNENVKYIKQFSLLDKQDSDTKEFNVRLTNENSAIGEKRFLEFKDLIEEISSINMEKEEKKLEDYVNSLIKFANEEERRDTFSKARLFTQDKLDIKENKSIDKLISSVEILIENQEYRDIIDKHIGLSELKNLIVELSETAIKLSKDKFFKKITNQIVAEVKEGLQIRSTSNRIEDVNFKYYLTCKNKIEKFNLITDLVKVNRTFQLEKIGRFDLVMKTGSYQNVTEIKNRVKTNIPLADIFKKSYHNGYEYLKELKNLNIDTTDYYKYFVNVKFDIMNEFNFPASGGERTEYNLLNEIRSASDFDILLIDEPESSFDNIFLNKEVNDLIKKLSKKMPVILATHNNTVGLSIAPDYLLYTKRTLENGVVNFEIYSGTVDSTHLKCHGKEEKQIRTKDVLIDALEAGEDAYTRRREIYEIYKNKK